MTSLVLGIDIGGSGSRCQLQTIDGCVRYHFDDGPPGVVDTSGSTAVPVAIGLIERALSRWPDAMANCGAVAVCATGLASLAAGHRQVAAQVARAAQVPKAVIATDILAAHLGALRGQPGTVVAVGTGAIALATDFENTFRRVDGWGHLIGDRGSGSWIGLAGLQAAAACHDGTDDSGAALLAAACHVFGEVPTWPGQLYLRPDRARVAATFAPAVIDLADHGDQRAQVITDQAGAAVAATATAASCPSVGSLVCAVGGLFARNSSFTSSFAAHLSAELTVVPAAGTVLDGAVHLATSLITAESWLCSRDGYLWLAEPGPIS